VTASSDSAPTARAFSGTVRLLTVAIAIVVAAMMAARWWFPDTVGSIGMQYAPGPSGQIRVEHVDPGLPAFALGLQKGDVIRADRMTFADRAALGNPVAGAPFDITFERDTRLTTARIVPARLAVIGDMVSVVALSPENVAAGMRPGQQNGTPGNRPRPLGGHAIG
jgi:hypothetical protein